MSRMLSDDEAVMFLFLKSHPKAFFFFFPHSARAKKEKKLQVKIDIINSGMLSQGTQRNYHLVFVCFVVFFFLTFYTGLILCTRNLHSLKE